MKLNTGRKTPLDELERTVTLYVKHNGSHARAATALGMSERALRDRLHAARRRGVHVPEIKQAELEPIKGRLYAEIQDGLILCASDAHYWPGPASTGHRAFVRFCERAGKDLKLVVMNGDAIDCAAISRHPPIGWTSIPTVKDEIEVTKERLDEIAVAAAKSAKHVRKIHPAGNHDLRFETKIATMLPELKGVLGTSLADHFNPDWEKCWSLFVNESLVIKHRFKGGMHAAMNNTLWAGRSTCTGHLHRLRVVAHSDYGGVRYGTECGCLADPYGPQFQDYTEDNPKAWQAGFVLFTIRAGRLLWPELIHVVEPGVVQHRGELIEV